ncbi:Oligopeptide transport ATP-binding protein OppD [Pseudovibrio axinellae]|uniref:Oligopeptide transport ATP-binding protein OppD n=1 Tax=Pseudovibrio axinellae TaxID=989403 RepID=A0A165ZH23_9HYPH|nr:ATP-binding cassette domain-containing protein [Pseudovibrio axinellae]KZL19892.1 Oligopeptide transport ATP-binding protein OppD [Pseudovibrio axinellae]SER38010.1 oligopeptide transport system ATP-binding protein [Pseudovibrio axinellae]
MALLDIQNLRITYDTPEGVVEAVKDVSLTVDKGETLAIVGESGSGKSQTAFATMGLLPHNAKVSGSIKYQGQEVIGLSQNEMNKLRSNEIAMIFQDPMTSLNPYLRISDQMAETLIYNAPDGKRMKKKDAIAECVRMLESVKIPDAKDRIHLYPHEFSGGMRQRVMIAMSLLCRPKLLIADEPTTALDVTVQARIMDLLVELQEEFHMAIVLITHNLGIVAGSCERTMVMYQGEVMEQGLTTDIFGSPTHPYTKGLLSAVPRLDQDEERLMTLDRSFEAQMAEEQL